MLPASELPSERQVHIAVAISAAILLGVVLINALALSTVTHDFANVYAAARIVRQGEGARLYDLAKQAEVEEQVFGWQGLFVFNHPPFEALLFAPLARLPYAAAYGVWGAVNIALWIFFVYLLRPYAPVPKHPLQYLLLCFVFFPVWVALMQGQMSILLLVLLALAFVAFKRRREGWAGVCVGLGLFKFPVTGALALICLLKGKWRFIAGFLSTACGLGAVSLLAIGPAGMTGYLKLLRDTMRRPDYPPYAIEVLAMPNLRGFFHALLTPLLPRSAVDVVVALASVSLIGYVAWQWRRAGSAEGPAFDRMFAAALLASLVAAYHLLIHDLSPALIAVLLILGSARYPQGSLWRSAQVTSLLALYVVPLCLLPLGVEPMYLLTPVLVLLVLAAMAGGPRAEADADMD